MTEPGDAPQIDAAAGLGDALRAELEAGLLGGARRWTRTQVAEQAGVPLDRARRLWVALGFAEDDDHEAVGFTDGDVAALRTIVGLVEQGVVDAADEVAVTRALGQSLSRLAEWQVTLVNRALVERVAGEAPEGGLDPDTLRQGVTRGALEVLPVLEGLQSYVWRRHLAAAAGRALVGPGEVLTRRTLVIGFADLVGYTSLTRRLDAAELATLLERFESTAMSAVAEHRAWVVKTVGDEVMFATDDPAGAARLAVELAERLAADDDLPGVRVGLALGEVLVRYGDAYGSVVNMAARLCAAAKPGRVLVDHELAAALSGSPVMASDRLELRAVRTAMRLHGFSRTHPSTLRRARR